MTYQPPAGPTRAWHADYPVPYVPVRRIRTVPFQPARQAQPAALRADETVRPEPPATFLVIPRPVQADRPQHSRPALADEPALTWPPILPSLLSTLPGPLTSQILPTLADRVLPAHARATDHRSSLLAAPADKTILSDPSDMPFLARTVRPDRPSLTSPPQATTLSIPLRPRPTGRTTALLALPPDKQIRSCPARPGPTSRPPSGPRTTPADFPSRPAPAPARADMPHQPQHMPTSHRVASPAHADEP
jgi:hypothetical protein